MRRRECASTSDQGIKAMRKLRMTTAVALLAVPAFAWGDSGVGVDTWLANKLSELGAHIKAGDVVLSGSFGGAVANPAFVLAQMIAQMKDRSGRIKIPGFYDDVKALEDEERKAWESLPFNERKYKKDFGIPKLFGETGYSTLERTWARPTLEVNGLLSGFTGEGAKTVLPSKAMAKVSCRLVPDQNPE